MQGTDQYYVLEGANARSLPEATIEALRLQENFRTGAADQHNLGLIQAQQ